MNTVVIRNERASKQVELATQDGVVEVSRQELSSVFGYTEDGIKLYQIFGVASDGLTFEVPMIRRGDMAMFQLDSQFGRTFVVHGNKLFNMRATDEFKEESSIKEGHNEAFTMSVVDMLRTLPERNSLRVSFSLVREIQQVEELPTRYDGNKLFEFPFRPGGSRTFGMDSKLDGHVWTNAITSNVSGFQGIVRIKKCGGHLQCMNQVCSGLLRSNEKNERHWVGRLDRVCPAGSIVDAFGSLKCFFCSTPPTCLCECPCKLIYCLPTLFEDKKISRGVIHLGFHMHPVAEGVARQSLLEVQTRVKEMVTKEFTGRPKSLQQKIAKEIVMESALFGEHSKDKILSDKDLSDLLAKLAPTLDKRRLSRWTKEAQVEAGHPTGDYDGIFKLKRGLLFDYFQSMVFPGQLEFSGFDRCHIFKMSTQGPGNGVELVNKMRSGGELGNCWLCFDFVKRMRDWTTMACHVYNPHIQEMQTIAIGDFKVEDTQAQALFWSLLNKVVEKEGYKKPKFKGFMADEAQANWRAIRTVYNGGPDKVMKSQERSCLFHWEQSLQQHAKKCIPPHSQEEFKRRCRQWKEAPSEETAQIELEKLQSWLRQGHADMANISMLETWLVWWHARVAHWGEYMIEAMKSDDQYMVPRTNLAESVHGSWLASNDGVKYISLYTACQGDLTTTLLQQSRYDSFLKGGHKGCGPGLQQIKNKRASMSSVPLAPSNVIDLTNEVAVELDSGKRRLSADGDARTVRRKRSGTIETPIAEGDSHRPEYEYVTQGIRQPRQKQEHRRICAVDEINIHPSRWAIRRTSPGSEVRCQGYLRDKGRKCNKLIDQKGRSGLVGVPAPCFQSMIKITPRVEKKQLVWFCGDDIDHTADPSNIVSERPISRPIVWPIAIGTCLDQNERDALWVAGFDLHTSSQDSQMQTTRGKQDQTQQSISLENDIDVRPLQREGKNVITYRTITKEMTKRIERANEMIFTIDTCKVVVANEHVEFNLSKVGDKENEESYKVVVSTFPSCTCEDFQMRERGAKRYMACKHLYFVFIKYLDLDVHLQKFVHQAALTKRELHQALHGVM